MLTLLSRIKIKKSHIVLIIIFMLLTAIGAMLLPTFLSFMIDDGVNKNNEAVIFEVAISMAITTIIACGANIIAVKISASVITNFSADLRKEIFKKIQSFSAIEMDKFGPGSLITRSTSDVEVIQIFFKYFLQFGLLAPFMIFAGLSLASTMGGELSVVLVVAIPILLVCSLAVIIVYIKLSNILRTKLDKINSLFLETLEGVRVIRAFNKQNFEKKRFGNLNKDYTKTLRQSLKITGSLTPLITLIMGLTTVGVMALGSYYVMEGQIEVGALIANNQYIEIILLAVVMLTVVLVVFPKAYTCSKRIAKVLNTDTSIVDGKKELDERPLRSTVQFKNVTFSYPNAEAPVLNNISFEANPGEFVAIIGRTGSGKSSVLKLIPRFYDVTFGEVLVDGINVKDYKTEDLRDLIGYVPQKNVLFSGDVASNLNFGNEEGKEEDWKRAAHIACADEFIDKKDNQYHADIAQGGTNLSGGQRQRMAIARAVMKKPEIYIFDDSFSALDMKTDRQVRTNIRENMGNATVIMVAQRISSIMDADRILVLENNQIIGNGKHKELLRSCPLYREIAVLQLGEEEVRREEI